MTQQPPKKSYNLLQITKSLQSVINRTYHHSFWITAEIAKLNYYPHSGHCYPDLVHKENGKVVAEMRSIIWNRDFNRINRKFKKIASQELQDGLSVMFLGKVSYSPKYGLSINITDIEPTFTLGAMAREKIATIERLKKENLFLKNRELKFPMLPKRIAIISVETSKGYSDFLSVIDKNKKGFKFEHFLFPALLQGDAAVMSIRNQLAAIKKVAQFFDVVTIIRGGGGDVGLRCYDNYSLSKDIAEFPLPVLTGIGHSTNETVVELVAYGNMITPTEMAFYLIEKFDKLDNKIDDYKNRIVGRVASQLTDEERKLKRFSDSVVSNIRFLINNQNVVLKNFSDNITSNIGFIINNQNVYLKNFGRMVVLHIKNQLQMENRSVGFLEEKVRLLDPKNVLKRGFSITTFKQKSITSSESLKNGDKIVTTFHHGSVESEVVNKDE
ncbi:MAG: exodeoxyribonuclease VII large subunit [Bacteroidota bacterium]|nr:exodeoxyribonuclease VII large subunit [Bacteroidota bacterium]